MEIRPITSQEELLKVVAVERAAWGFEDHLESTPPHIMQATNKTGGFVLGAFEEEQLLGFCYTIAAFDQDLKAYHHMHSLGVIPEARSLHPGHAILLAHQQASLQMGIDKITWTFDPLEARNANLYMRKIGAVVETPYIANMYGNVLGGINAGIAADRLIATWYLKEATQFQNASVTLEELQATYSIFHYSDDKQTIPTTSFLVEIPVNFQGIKLADMQRAKQIRLRVRAVMTECLSKQRKLIKFFSVWEGENRRNFYLVE